MLCLHRAFLGFTLNLSLDASQKLYQVCNGVYKQNEKCIKCGVPIVYKVCNFSADYTHVVIYLFDSRPLIEDNLDNRAEFLQWTVAFARGTDIANLPTKDDTIMTAPVLLAGKLQSLQCVKQWHVNSKNQLVVDGLSNLRTIECTIKADYVNEKISLQALAAMRDRIYQVKTGTHRKHLRTCLLHLLLLHLLLYLHLLSLLFFVLGFRFVFVCFCF